MLKKLKNIRNTSINTKQPDYLKKKKIRRWVPNPPLGPPLSGPEHGTFPGYRKAIDGSPFPRQGRTAEKTRNANEECVKGFYVLKYVKGKEDDASPSSGSGRRYLPFFAHLQKEATVNQAEDEEDDDDDQEEEAATLDDDRRADLATAEEEEVEKYAPRYQQVSVIQRTPLFRPREPEAERRREVVAPPSPKKTPHDVDDDYDMAAEDADDEEPPVQEAPIDYHVPRPKSPCSDEEFPTSAARGGGAAASRRRPRESDDGGAIDMRCVRPRISSPARRPPRMRGDHGHQDKAMDGDNGGGGGGGGGYNDGGRSYQMGGGSGGGMSGFSSGGGGGGVGGGLGGGDNGNGGGNDNHLPYGDGSLPPMDGCGNEFDYSRLEQMGPLPSLNDVLPSMRSFHPSLYARLQEPPRYVNPPDLDRPPGGGGGGGGGGPNGADLEATLTSLTSLTNLNPFNNNLNLYANYPYTGFGPGSSSNNNSGNGVGVAAHTPNSGSSGPSPCGGTQADLFELASDPDMCADDQNSFCPDVDQITGLQLTFPVEGSMHMTEHAQQQQQHQQDRMYQHSRVYSSSPSYSQTGQQQQQQQRRNSPSDDGLGALGNFSPSALLTPLSIDQSPLMDVQFGSSQMSPCSINSSSPTPGSHNNNAGLHSSHTPAPQPPHSSMSVDQSDNESVSNLQDISLQLGLPGDQPLEFVNGGHGIKNPLVHDRISGESKDSTRDGSESDSQSSHHHLPSHHRAPSTSKSKRGSASAGGSSGPGSATGADPDDPSKFTCRLCSKHFTLQRLLNRHMKCHSDVKRYLCTFCGKGFNDTFDLKRHTRTHTGVRPYKCALCEKSFTQRCSLESHCLKVHGVAHQYQYKERRAKVYVCEECGHTTNEPEVHYVHLKENHPYSPALLKFYDKRHFKFTNSNFTNMLLQVRS
nr:EOG090X020Y [Ilyocryptus agilis]